MDVQVSDAIEGIGQRIGKISSLELDAKTRFVSDGLNPIPLDLEFITETSAFVSGMQTTGKTTAIVAASQFYADQLNDKGVREVFRYFISFGKSTVDSGNLGLHAMLVEYECLDVRPHITPGVLVGYLDHGRYQVRSTIHENNFMDRPSWKFQADILRDPPPGVYIFDDVNWLGLLPEETQEHFVQEVIVPLAAHEQRRVYLIEAYAEREEQLATRPKAMESLSGFRTIEMPEVQQEVRPPPFWA